MTFVVDTSVTMAWCFEDEASPATEAIFDRLRADGAIAPTIWPFEVANALLVGERRQRLSRTEVARFIDLLESLPITVDEQGGLASALGSVLAVARDQGLSAHDASYLELAMREGLPLATQDARTRAAAVRLGVERVEAEPRGGGS